jgi:SpoIIAA-like
VLKIIEGMPPDVLAIEAVGTVTHQDYRATLIPKAEAMLAKRSIKMLYVIGKEFTGYALEALWDDGAFGIKHWREFGRIAVVTDLAWMRASISMFAPFFPAEVRLFDLSELPRAKDWIIDTQQVAA